jgi:predicted nucleotidyltransferase
MRATQIPMLHCYRCAYSWYPRISRVRTCPRCKSIKWDVPRIQRKRRPVNGLGVREIVGARRGALLRLLRRYGAREVRVFGSVARGAATPSSDLDLLVRFDQPIGLMRRAELEEKMEALLRRNVDLVTESALHWFAKPQILSEAAPL